MAESVNTSPASELIPDVAGPVSNRAAGSSVVPEPALNFGPEGIARFIRLYASNPIFADTGEWMIEDNPYRRPVHQSAVGTLDFNRPLRKAEVFARSALAAHRMLLNIYETDLLFLPNEGFAAKKNDFARFYSNENKILGEIIRPTLEAHAFAFLEDEVSISREWSIDSLRSYLCSLIEAHERTGLDIVTAVLSSREPEKSAIDFLVQVASDFLTESSATARNVLGKYGAIQSELFRILIDDYGHGFHHKKHSTLFENTMASLGLSTQAHSYWQFYLGSSLALGNYYHYVSRNHSKFFRCLGAMAFAESMFAHTCRQVAEMLRRVFGARADTRYFDEHGDIDADHGRMAVDNIVVPAVRTCGDGVLDEVVRGLEEIRLLTAISDEDFIEQVNWSDALGEHKSAARPICKRIKRRDLDVPAESLAVRREEPLITDVNGEDRLFAVERGALSVYSGYDRSIRIDEGEGMVIPRHRLFGLATSSEECVYRAYSLEDYKTSSEC